MKVLAVLLVVVIAGVALIVTFGGVTEFDPAAGAEEFVAQVQPGMSWQQVIGVKAPKKFAIYTDNPERPHGAIGNFNQASFTTSFQNGSFKWGFFFVYRFDTEHHYHVIFDEQGNVSYVEEQMTFSDLLGG